MKIDNDIRSITIGSFDGLHLAHRRLIELADMIVVIERGSGYLTAGYRRSRHTDKPITIYSFDKIKSLTPSEFISKLKNAFPKLREIIVGYDFRFGSQKAGDVSTLAEIFDGKLTVVDEIIIDEVSVHSRTIKALLRDGKIADANRLLGRKYSIDGTIHSGQGLGAKELVPTLNIYTEHYLLPLDGVYATETLIDGRWVDSISFLGHRVSTDGSYAIETHLLGGDIGAVTGKIEIAFVQYIRANKKFDSLTKLKEQIEIDINSAKTILQGAKND